MRHVATRGNGVRRTDRTGAISTDIATTLPPSVDNDRSERYWERRKREISEDQAYVVGLLEQMARSMGGILANTQAAPLNDVLRQGTYQIPSSGVWVAHWPQAFSAVAIANGGSATHPLTVSSQQPTPGGTAPKVGNGVFVVPSGYFRVVTMRGNNLAVYGNAGTYFDVAVYIRPRTPSAGACGTFA